MSADAIDTFKDDIGNKPIGTGPYKVTDWASGDHADVTVNEDYWGDAPKIKNLHFVTAPEASTRTNMLLTGEAGFAVDIEANDIKEIDDSGVAEIRYDDTNRVAQIGFNLEKEPFNNPLVRQAMNYAIDKEAIVSGIMNGTATVANNVVAAKCIWIC